MDEMTQKVTRHNDPGDEGVPAGAQAIEGRLQGVALIEELIRTAESRSKVRTQIPAALNHFPIRHSRFLQRLVLRLYEWLFRDQRTASLALIEVARALLSENRRLANELDQLLARQVDMEDRLEKYLPSAGTPILDDLYRDLEDCFRGSEEDIRNRLAVYLPVLDSAAIGSAEMPVLDIGCGRGEWLLLLTELGKRARGVDTNTVMSRLCKERGLEVVECDAVTYLRGLADESLGAVTGFHVVEHLSFDYLISLLDQIARVLKPGGLVILETPNPENVRVGSNTFYLDPTHRNPLPAPLMKFLVEARGLRSVTIQYLHPCSESTRIEDGDIAERFNEYFYGPQDYAVLGRKE